MYLTQPLSIKKMIVLIHMKDSSLAGWKIAPDIKELIKYLQTLVLPPAPNYLLSWLKDLDETNVINTETKFSIVIDNQVYYLLVDRPT